VAERAVPSRIAAAIALGTLLNPLNSSMIAVALVDLQREFQVGLATSSWLVSGFYLTAAVGQPLMGRLADRYGPRRVFTAGLALVAVTGVLVLFAPGFGWVVAARVLQAVGTSVGFPAGLAVVRRLAGGRPPAGTLGIISATNSASAAFGPVLGGVLVAAAGWRGIFAVNIPLAAAGVWLARRWLPADPPAAAADTRAFLRDLDLPGVALFSLTITSLLGFLLSAAWPLLPVVPVAAALFAWRELRAPSPFLDLRGLAAHRPLVRVLGQQIAVQCVFYLIFFGLPQWLEKVRDYSAATTGLLMLPVTALGLQAGLYAATPAGQTGTSAGLFQTGRYVGAILSTALLGAVYGGTPSTSGLHRAALLVTASAALLAGAALSTPAPGGRHRAGADHIGSGD
jgi:MFS family permease